MSIKVDYSDRPLTPIEVAEDISELKRELNDDYKQLQKRLPIKKDMIKNFERLLLLPKEIQDSISFGDSRSGGVLSFSTAAAIARLDDRDDMVILGLAVIDLPRPIRQTEVKDIISLKKKNKDKEIEDCISEILKITRPKVIRRYIFISGLKKAIIARLKFKAKKEHKKLDDVALEILSSYFSKDEAKSVNVFSDFMRISLSKEGHDRLHRIPKEKEILLKDVVNYIFEKRL